MQIFLARTNYEDLVSVSQKKNGLQAMVQTSGHQQGSHLPLGFQKHILGVRKEKIGNLTFH